MHNPHQSWLGESLFSAFGEDQIVEFNLQGDPQQTILVRNVICPTMDTQ
jgi:hypothetical protein